MICDKTTTILVFSIKYIPIERSKQENKNEELSIARSLQSLLFFVSGIPCYSSQLSLILFFLLFSQLFFLTNGSPLFLSCVLFLYLRLKTTKSMWSRVSFFVNLGLHIFLCRVAALSINTYIILSTIARRLLQ